MAMAEDEPQSVAEFFDTAASNPCYTVNNNRRTATLSFDNVPNPALKGGNIYRFGIHDIRIRFDNLPINSSVWVGVVVDDQPPLPNDLLKTVGWLCEVGDAFGRSLTGDVLRLNFDWIHQTISAENERTLWNHTIYNAMRPRQLVIIMETIGTVVSLLPM